MISCIRFKVFNAKSTQRIAANLTWAPSLVDTGVPCPQNWYSMVLVHRHCLGDAMRLNQFVIWPGIMSGVLALRVCTRADRSRT